VRFHSRILKKNADLPDKVVGNAMLFQFQHQSPSPSLNYVAASSDKVAGNATMMFHMLKLLKLLKLSSNINLDIDTYPAQL